MRRSVVNKPYKNSPTPDLDRKLIISDIYNCRNVCNDTSVFFSSFVGIGPNLYLYAIL